MKGLSNDPSAPTQSICYGCGRIHDNCDGEECDECHKWFCYRCMTGIPGRRLCEGCQVYETEKLDPVAPNYREWLRKQEDKREAKAMALEEARGK